MKKRNHLIASASALAIVFGCWQVGVLAETTAKTPPPPSSNFKGLPAPSPDKVSGPEISVLIRTTLIALQQANDTGNFTVLRDLGSASFRTVNNPVKLGNIYGKIHEAGVDLSPAVLIDPFLVRPPIIDANRVLIIEGFFPTQPLNITFKMGFRFEFGAWRLLSLSVGGREPQQGGADTKKAVSGNNESSGKSNADQPASKKKKKPSTSNAEATQ